MKSIKEAAALLESIRSMQIAGQVFPCPRCGQYRMDAVPCHNSLSRYADVYICNDCGMNEALMAMKGRSLPLNKWSAVMAFDKENGITAEIRSNKGFYIGDVCYVLDKYLYHEVWGNEHHFEDGSITDPKTGLQFAVSDTAYGDGCYEDNYGNYYPVDAGCIGLIPLELVSTGHPEADGVVIHESGIAHFEAVDGKFTIVTPSGKIYEIDTH